MLLYARVAIFLHIVISRICITYFAANISYMGEITIYSSLSIFILKLMLLYYGLQYIKAYITV